MRLPFFHAKDPVVAADARPRARKAAAAAASEPGALDAARVRARRRLIGAVVLLGVGILGFPLLFETKPRPLPIDTPIDASRVDLTNPRVASGAVAPQRPLPVVPADAGNEGPVAGAAAAAAAVALAPPAAGPAPVPPPALPPAAPPAAVPAIKPPAVAPSAAAAPKPSAPKAPVDATPSAPPVVAPALPPPAAEAAAAGSTLPRYVVQVGAFNDNARMREARMKVERIGYATYISEVDSPTGRRTRVRLGPFTNKDEADAAALKVKAAGLPANILKL